MDASAERVFPRDVNRARLRPLFAVLFRKGHASADFEARERIVENAVAMEIDFAAIGGPEESESGCRIDSDDRA